MPGGYINGGFNIGRSMFPVPFGNFILDTFTGATAAHSLEKLASSTSNVVRVRRSSDDTEQDFTAAGVSDGTLTTFTGAGDGFVTTWYDQSGNGRDATQSTAASQGKIVTSGVLETENGKPTVIGGVNIGYDVSVPFASSLTAFGIANANSGASDGQRFFSDTTRPLYEGILAGDTGKGLFLSGSNAGLFYRDSLSNEWRTRNTMTLNQQNLVSWLWIGIDGGEVYVNGSGGFTVDEDTSDSLEGGIINNVFGRYDISTGIVGNMQANILYDSDQSANRAAIEAKIADIYGITLA